MFKEYFQDQPFLYEWIILPLMIFLSRASDVSLGTLRNILINKNQKKVVPFIGFCEAMLWLFAVSGVLGYVSNWIGYLAWGLGFATGIFIGIKIDEKLGLGYQLFQIITHLDVADLLHHLKAEGFTATVLKGEGTRGSVLQISLIVLRTENARIRELIRVYAQGAFYTVADIRESNAGVFPQNDRNNILFYVKRLLPLHK